MASIFFLFIIKKIVEIPAGRVVKKNITIILAIMKPINQSPKTKSGNKKKRTSHVIIVMLPIKRLIIDRRSSVFSPLLISEYPL